MLVGIVGLPYVGKSSLFRALCGGNAPAPAGPDKPALSMIHLPDPRLAEIASFIETKKLTHATMQTTLVPGLMRSEGASGKGNAFLQHIRDVDALCHVVRCFEDDSVAHVDSSVDPMRDIETVETELILADMQSVENALPKAERAARAPDREAKARLRVLQKAKPALEDIRPIRTLLAEGAFDDPEEAKAMRGMAFLSAKRMLYVANVGEDDLSGESAHAQAVKNHAESEGMQSIAVCAKLEAELADMAEADRAEMLEGLGLSRPALPQLAEALHRLLGLQVFYTAGPKEVRAWTIRAGETAPEAAGAVHSDIQRGFIRAEIYSVADLAELKTEKAIKEAGRMRVEGKSYVMQDGDVTHFLFNV